ncbi:MAG: tRNA (adenosine(37)-N6)-threonylcarbamoyltransferase complex transferase subunit TsaD [Phycisphaerales bacterium]|jgi:N6-L-threonylcarbamoyladenine synthase|nr:tRNA (adenosine(37)-N6)-threonylcarbamoyltransferase complex transferase subunit TsaD [Phycisphaerales bacterium]
MPLILGIESTCDETSAAIVADGWGVRSNVVSSQVELHAKYRGVVPEIASRAHLQNILPVLREALRDADCGLDQVDAVAVAHRPGLIGSLLIGVTAAKAIAWALHKPLIGVDHVHAHLYSVVLETNSQPPMPAVGLVCSGGHTALYAMRSMEEVSLIGSTLDDAVGEAYDKVASILGLGYPGGPIIDRLAQQGDPKVLRFPRTYLQRDSLDFSFSGLKTAVLYHVRGVPGKVSSAPKEPPTGQELADLAAGFQAACVDVLIEKLRRAASRIQAKSIIVGGGVSANTGLRNALPRLNLPVFAPPLRYCTDNAAMTAGLAFRYLQAGQFSPLDLDAIPYSRFTEPADSR